MDPESSDAPLFVPVSDMSVCIGGIVALRQIVCLSDAPWNRYPLRAQQLLTRIRDSEILYFDPPVTVLARFGGRKAAKAASAYRKREQQVRTNIHVGALPPIWPMYERYPLLERSNARKLARHILRTLDAHRLDNPVLWLCSPLYALLTEELPFSNLVYDCAGSFPHLPQRMEESVARSADIVFAASPRLASRLAAWHPNVALVPDGSDFSVFAHAGQTLSDFPKGLFNVQGPILGFAGILPSKPDFAPLEHAATLRPDWNFVFAGRWSKAAFPESIRSLKNVFCFPCPSPAEASEYAAHFQVFFQLKQKGTAPPDRLPTAVLDALSTGRPVVSMEIPEHPELYEELISFAQTPAEFAALCRKALVERSDWMAQRRIRFAASSAWNQRAADATRFLEANGIV